LPLSDRQRLFIEEYLQCWNATEAARRAGYSLKTAYSIGSENLTKPEIKVAIENRIKEKHMQADEVLARLTQQARGAGQDFIEVKGTLPFTNWEKLEEAGGLNLIKKLKYDNDGRPEVEFYDAQVALVHLGRHLGLFVDRVELTDKNGSGSSPFELPADCMSESFIKAYRDIKRREHTEYLFYGGRGSTKSSFISLVIIYLLINNPTIHVLAMRQVADTLRDSVYNQLLWAIGELGVSDRFKTTTSPMEMTYLPTGQKIFFRGADDPGKIKSIKPAHGYIGILWLEELDQYRGEEAVRKIEQSVIRGGDLAYIFKSFNPPRTASNWANKYVKIPKASQYQHKSSYLEVPPEWLGKPWIEEAEHLKIVNPAAYAHEYLGEVNGTGGAVFENVQLRKIANEEIAQFDRVLHGLDWGYYPDPAAYNRCHYDAARLTLYIFGEYRAHKLANRLLWDALVERGVMTDDLIIADSAEPKSVADFRDYGSNCRGAEKGPESVKYSMKWLQSLRSIVIDNERCPETAQEFLDYELEQDKDGNFISDYPDKNNHQIDAVRYATNLIWRRRGE
jgi:phage terminase large subunit